MWEKYVITAS